MARKRMDPEFGEIVAPQPPHKADFERDARNLLEVLSCVRHWPRGSVSRCPSCSRESFVGRDDLEVTIGKTGGVIIFRHLQGARCDACGSQVLEPGDLVRVESEAAAGVVSDYEAKVSRIGSGTLGTYWPKDVVRNLDLAPDKKAFIQVLDHETALIRFGRIRSRPRDSPPPTAAVGATLEAPVRKGSQGRKRSARGTLKH